MSFLSAPTYPFLGAFFPAWMLYAFVSVILTLMVRGVFIRVGVDDLLPLRLTSYTALAIAIGCALALATFDR